MRIAFSGTQNTGKTTLVKAFLDKYPMFLTPEKTYRDIITENNLTHSSNTTAETQLLILDWMMKNHEKYAKSAKVVHDRCVWDNLAYTLVGNAHGQISDEVTAASISLVRESLKHLDIIFWLPYSDHIQIVDDGMRDINKTYLHEVDSIFEQLYEQYCENLESDIFYPKEDTPAIIRLEGLSVDDRLAYIGEFIDPQGNPIAPDDTLFSDENLKILEDLLKDQELAKASDDYIKQIKDSIITKKDK
jgi:deoxyadenosine/deoxycytidine kinase